MRHGGRVLGHLRHAAGRNDLHAGGRRCRLHAVRALLPQSWCRRCWAFSSAATKWGWHPRRSSYRPKLPPRRTNLVRVIILGALLAALSIFFCGAAPRHAEAVPEILSEHLPACRRGRRAHYRLDKAAGHHRLLTARARRSSRPPSTARPFPTPSFLKMLFTALTLGAGFKGGGSYRSSSPARRSAVWPRRCWNLPPQLGAALGMVALFCGCTNSPLASICALPSRYSAGSASRCLRWHARFPTCCRAISAFTASSTSCIPAAHRRRAAGTRPLVRDGRRIPDHKRRRRKLEKPENWLQERCFHAIINCYGGNGAL